MTVVAAVVLDRGRVLVVSKKAAPDVFYLPGGKPEPGEEPEETLRRELDEELGVAPLRLRPLAVVEDVAELEKVPMRMTVLLAHLDEQQVPAPAAELAAVRWVDVWDADQDGTVLARAVRRQVLPLLRELPGLRYPASVPSRPSAGP